MQKNGDGKFVLDDNYVEMPFSNEDTWRKAKLSLSRPLLCYQDFHDTVISYNNKFRDLWKRFGIANFKQK